MVETSSATTIVAADHPSLDDQVAQFIDALRSETRFFGPSARSNPKPFPSLLSELRQREGFRLAAMTDGRLAGLVRVDDAGRVHIAVVPEHRGEGIGTALLVAAIERAGQIGFGRLTLRSRDGSRAVRRLGEGMGCTAIGDGHGRLDLIMHVPRPDAESA